MLKDGITGTAGGVYGSGTSYSGNSLLKKSGLVGFLLSLFELLSLMGAYDEYTARGCSYA